MDKTVLVTGGSGYFGSKLIQNLRSKGFECRNFDINKPVEPQNKVEFVQGDIRNIREITSACEGIDIVHHNVAQVPLAKDDKLFKSVNYEGVENILNASLRNKVKKVVYTSSSAVFGVPTQNPVTELTIPTPAESYGKAKFEGEIICKEYIDKGLDVTIIRPRTIMGQGRLGIFQILFEWIFRGQNIPVFNGGNNLYQFIHSDDLAEACFLAAETTGPNLFNCGTTDFGSMREVLEQLCEYSNSGSKIRSLPMKPAMLGMNIFSKLGLSPLGSYHALMYGKSMYFDVTKVQKTLGWQPKYSNFEMFQEGYDWYVDNRKMILQSNFTSPHKSAVKQGILSLVGKLL